MRPYAAVAVAGLLAFAACSGDEDDTTTTTARPAATSTTAASASAERDVEAARQQFLAIVAPANESVAALNAAQTNDQAVAELGRLAAAIETMAAALQGAAWPNDVQDEIDEVISTAMAMQAVVSRMVQNPSALTEFQDQFNQAIADGAAASSAARLALGLPVD